MLGELLIKKQSGQSLDGFIVGLSALIGCEKWEQRQSSNYVGERYYRCAVLGLEITAAVADDAEFADYDFWLTLEARGVVPGDKAFLAGMADWVARVMAVGGYEVLRPLEPGRAGSGAVLYRGNPSAANLLGRVITEDV